MGLGVKIDKQSNFETEQKIVRGEIRRVAYPVFVALFLSFPTVFFAQDGEFSWIIDGFIFVTAIFTAIVVDLGGAPVLVAVVLILMVPIVVLLTYPIQCYQNRA